MSPRLDVRPQGPISKFFDTLMIPIMHIATWTLERPQETHRWNNHHLKEEDVAHLDKNLIVSYPGVKKTFNPPLWIYALRGIFIHLSWKHYLVIDVPDFRGPYYVGWIYPGGAGVSRIQIVGASRVSLGAGKGEWFAIDSKSGQQLPLRIIGAGRINDGSEFSRLPLI